MEFSGQISLACRSLKLTFSLSGQILLLFYNTLLLLQFLMKTLILQSVFDPYWKWKSYGKQSSIFSQYVNAVILNYTKAM